VTRNVSFSSAERICSHLGALVIDGVRVEIMGNVQLKRENGSWEEPADLERSKRTLNIEGIRIPAMSLEHAYQAYAKLRREKKAEIVDRSI
jgi:hypothetical protein